jgi:hypothetical protein
MSFGDKYMLIHFHYQLISEMTGIRTSTPCIYDAILRLLITTSADTTSFTLQNKNCFIHQNYSQILLSPLKKNLSLLLHNEHSRSNHLKHDVSYSCKSSCTINLAMSGLDSSGVSTITKNIQ